MKKIINDSYLESYYEETLDNGLHVVIWHKEDFQKSLFMMATPFGAMHLHQKNNVKTYMYPAGIAHFLEHKMFAMKDEDVMELFSKMGANVNAFTSYSETCYYTSTSDDPLPPLKLLLDFVQELDIDEASVEKEKGIIVQELHMYKEMSDQRLLMETYSSLFQNHPLKEDIGGDDESVRSIDVEMLRECYQVNYHPKRMMLFAISGSDPERLMETIKENQASKTFPSYSEVATLPNEEPTSVKRPIYTFMMDVSTPKICVAYKLSGIQDPLKRNRIEWALRFLLDANFSSLYPQFQTWLDDGVINDYYGCDIDFGEDYGVLMFYTETLKKDEFIKLCEDTMKRICNADIKDEIIEQLKRRYYGQSVRSLNDFDDIAISYIRCYFAGMDFFQSLDCIHELHIDDMQEAASLLNERNRSIIELLPEKTKKM